MFLFIFQDVLNSETKSILAILIVYWLHYFSSNKIVNNLDRFVFLKYPNRHPNWVAIRVPSVLN